MCFDLRLCRSRSGHVFEVNYPFHTPGSTGEAIEADARAANISEILS